MAYKHHTIGIKKMADKIKEEAGVLSVIVGGSIAHETEREDSDIDVMIVISDEDHSVAYRDDKTSYSMMVEAEGKEIFVDGKYISLSYIKDVIEQGSEPARYAFSGAFIAYSTIDGLDELIKEAAQYPLNKKAENIDRFWSQFRAWEWYSLEALKRSDDYLLRHSVNKMILFAGRMILAHNETLFPYHKWFMNELTKASEKPENFVQMIKELLDAPNRENIGKLFDATVEYMRQMYDLRDDWPNIFMRDSELGWRVGNIAVDDL